MNNQYLSTSPGIPPASWLDPFADWCSQKRARFFGDPKVPTLMHITHAKAGSTWVTSLLHELFRSRVSPRGKQVAALTGGDLDRHVFAPGRIYPAMFMARQQVLAHPELNGCKRLIVIRDLRETLAALYFSLKLSHPRDSAGRTRELYEMLNSCDTEEGLLHLLELQIPHIAALQASWMNQGEVVVQYSEAISDTYAVLHEALIARLGLPVSPRALARAIRNTQFAGVFRRPSAQSGPSQSDWQTLFTPEVRRRFSEQYGDVLIATGCARNLAWAH